MHIHTVYFWLKEGLGDDERRDFEAGLTDLMTCKTIHKGYWGKPADTHREVVDRSYAYSITVFFETLDDHNVYQDDPDHNRFIERCLKYWDRVQVYDMETDA